MKHTLLAVALLSVAALAHAETSPAKKELINKIVQLQLPNGDGIARQLTEQPVAQLLQQLVSSIPFRVPVEKRDALGKEIQADVKKYVDDVGPLLRERVGKIAPGAITPVLEEKFSEDELRQLLAAIESPVLRKFSQLNAEMQKGVLDKVVAETKGQVEPKLKALGQSVEKRINTAAATSPAGSTKPAIK